MYRKSERKLGLQETFKNLSRHLRPEGRVERACVNSPDSPAEIGEIGLLRKLVCPSRASILVGI